MNVRSTRLAVVHETRPATILTEYASCRFEPNGVIVIRPQPTAAPGAGAARSAAVARRLVASRSSRMREV
jgi:hypothetical protein